MDELILDDPAVEKEFQSVLLEIKARRNGDVAESMNQKGISWKMNWGVSVMDLREIAASHHPGHLLALKLWNKNWRETRILATLLDDPKAVTEEQIDFWTKSFENTEIAEQAVANLWVKTPFAYVKALEWCRGKKHIVRFTGLQLMGRLALADKKAIDEMFEPFFGVLEPLSRDPELNTVFYRSFILIGSRSFGLYSAACNFAQELAESGFPNSAQLGKTLLDEFRAEYYRSKFHGGN
jgi:hypothetical protein